MNIHERLKILRKKKSISLEDAGKAIGVSWQTVQQWENGKTAPKRQRLDDVANFYNVSINYLLHGTEDQKINDISIQSLAQENVEYLSNSVSIPILNASGSMGIGNEMTDQELVVEVLRVSKSWVDKTLGQITGLENLSFIHAIGDSMMPTFNDGDILLVDSGVKHVSSDSVYVLSAHDRLFIKRVRRRLDGTFEISSDNPSVKTVDVLNGDHQVTIKGRVVWVWNGKKI